MDSKLIKKLDDVFSKYIRLKYSNENGYCKCVSCNTIDYYKDMDAGHYIDRKHMSTRWDEDNVRPQCRVCNRMKYGNLEGYLQNIGDAMGEYLTKKKYKIKKYDNHTLKLLIELYQSLTNKLI